jgi:antirestriction protein
METEIAGKIIQITDAMVIEYTLADYGEKLGIYPDGSYAVGESVGNEIAESERPMIVVKCPGIGNIDCSWYAAGWAHYDSEKEAWIDDEKEYDGDGGAEMTTEEMIARCITEGDGQPHEILISQIQQILSDV